MPQSRREGRKPTPRMEKLEPDSYFRHVEASLVLREIAPQNVPAHDGSGELGPGKSFRSYRALHVGRDPIDVSNLRPGCFPAHRS